MARVTFAVNKLTNTYETGLQNGGTPVDLSRIQYTFQNVGGMADIGTQGTTIATEGTTIATSSSLVSTDITAVNVQLGSLIATIGGGTGSASAAALQTLVNTATTDVAANVVLANANVVLANAIKAAGTADIQVSVNTANITRVQQLKAAFDQCIGMALGGWGGMTK